MPALPVVTQMLLVLLFSSLSLPFCFFSLQAFPYFTDHSIISWFWIKEVVRIGNEGP